MKISVFSDNSKKGMLQEFLKRHSKRLVFYDTYDEFISELPGEGSDILIVACDGAHGMESVRAAKILLPDIPLIWFSDDKGFGPESYRVGCTYFSALPITEDILEKAMKRCEI